MKVYEKKSYVLADTVNGGYWHATLQRTYTSQYESFHANGPDGPEMAADKPDYAQWLHCDVRATEIHAKRKPVAVTSHYELKPEFGPTGANPAALTPEQYAERCDDDDFLSSLYVPVREVSGDGEWEVWEVSADDAEGSPWPDDLAGTGLSWKVDQGAALGVDARFHHLLPGALQGVLGAITKELDAIPNCDAYDRSEWQVYKRFPNPTPPKPKKGPGSRTEPKRTWTTIRVPIPKPPRSIAAENLADAIQNYRAKRDAAIAQFNAVHRCDACDGKGWAS